MANLPPEFLPIARGNHSIVSYSNRLQTLYTRPDMQHLELDHWKMAELQICTNELTTPMRRVEYLIATFTDSANGNEQYHLIIARQLQLPSGCPDNEQDDAPIMQFGMRVLDHLHLQPHKDQLPIDHPAERITFREGHRISLPKFILLACAVRECSREHPLKRANCHWFCFAMMEAMKAQSPEHNWQLVQRKKVLWRQLLCENFNVNELLYRTEQMWSHLGHLRIQANVD